MGIHGDGKDIKIRNSMREFYGVVKLFCIQIVYKWLYKYICVLKFIEFFCKVISLHFNIYFKNKSLIRPEKDNFRYKNLKIFILRQSTLKETLKEVLHAGGKWYIQIWINIGNKNSWNGSYMRKNIKYFLLISWKDHWEWGQRNARVKIYENLFPYMKEIRLAKLSESTFWWLCKLTNGLK